MCTNRWVVKAERWKLRERKKRKVMSAIKNTATETKVSNGLSSWFNIAEQRIWDQTCQHKFLQLRCKEKTRKKYSRTCKNCGMILENTHVVLIPGEKWQNRRNAGHKGQEPGPSKNTNQNRTFIEVTNHSTANPHGAHHIQTSENQRRKYLKWIGGGA